MTRRTARNVARSNLGTLTALEGYVIKHGRTPRRERIKGLLVAVRALLAKEIHDARNASESRDAKGRAA